MKLTTFKCDNCKQDIQIHTNWLVLTPMGLSKTIADQRHYCDLTCAAGGMDIAGFLNRLNMKVVPIPHETKPKPKPKRKSNRKTR